MKVGIWWIRMCRKKENILEKYIKTAKKYNAEISEFILWAEWKVVENRILKRWFRKNSTFTMEKAGTFWEEINKFKEKRKNIFLEK